MYGKGKGKGPIGEAGQAIFCHLPLPAMQL